MKTVYLVWGCTGEHEDYYEWNVCAYENEKQAIDHVKLLRDWLEDEKLIYSRDINSRTCLPIKKATGYKCGEEIKCPCDSSFSIDYTGTDYEYAEIKVYEEGENYTTC